MDSQTHNTLELGQLRTLLARHLRTPLGHSRLEVTEPTSDRARIDRELDLTTECTALLQSGGSFGLTEIVEPEPTLDQLRVAGASLDPGQILDLLRLMVVGLGIRDQFREADSPERYPRLSSIAARIPDLKQAVESIRGKILPNGEIDDNASPELRRLRREINQRRARIYRSLESLMRDRGATVVQDEIVTVRNGRFVIPVRTDARGEISGVVHGHSSSGQTAYIEPLATIEQNNEMVSLREQEEIETARILSTVTAALREHIDGLRLLVEAIGEVDFAQAKARLSTEFACVRPLMIEDASLVLRDARHPLLEHLLRDSGGTIVPITLELDPGHQTVVISGPNAGGKTVVVKTAGLLSLMAQMGLHVPAAEARLPVFRQVLADIGDQQSMAANLSTFTAHMSNIARMAGRVTPPALILIDEVGTGTDPDEGSALAIAIVDWFRRAGATTIATTHYNQLKIWASGTPGVLSASVEFDDEKLRPTYRLRVGIAGASSGLEIARRMDLPSEIIDQAKEVLDPVHAMASDYLKRLGSLLDEVEAQRAALEEEREATAQKFARLDLEFARRDSESRAELEHQLERIVREFREESARMIGEVGDKLTSARLRKEADARAAQLSRAAAVRVRKISGPKPAEERAPDSPTALVEPGEIRERDRVLIKSLNHEGVVESIDGDTCTVLVGSLRFRATLDDLSLIKKTPRPASARVAALPRGVTADVREHSDFNPEIKVIGCTVEEATERLDKFLDEAVMAGSESVRVVHGHGTGALRRALSEMLKDHPHVERFERAPASQGGAGATIVELRK